MATIVQPGYHKYLRRIDDAEDLDVVVTAVSADMKLLIPDGECYGLGLPVHKTVVCQEYTNGSSERESDPDGGT